MYLNIGLRLPMIEAISEAARLRRTLTNALNTDYLDDSLARQDIIALMSRVDRALIGTN